MTRGQIYSKMLWTSTIAMLLIWFLFGFNWVVPQAGEMDQSTLEPYTWFDHIKWTIILFAAGDFGGFYGQVVGYWVLKTLFG